MKPSEFIKLYPAVLFAVPVVLFINPHAVPVLLWSAGLLFFPLLAISWWCDRKAAAERKARMAAILASKPAYMVFGSGAPPWLAAPIYIGFILAALALVAWESVGPDQLRGFNGFLTVMMMGCALPFAMFAAAGVWKALAWHLRSRFPDKLLAFANDLGIGTPDGWVVIPYTHIRRIDPCGRRSRYGINDWIEIADEFGPRRVPVNMTLDPPDEILKQLRDRALAGGADLAPALPNDRPPGGGTQLGYRMGYERGE